MRFPKLSELRREKTPTLFLVTSGNDQSFLPFGRRDRLIDTSRFDVGGVSEEGPTKGLNAFLFSDRGIYRPGDDPGRPHREEPRLDGRPGRAPARGGHHRRPRPAP